MSFLAFWLISTAVVLPIVMGLLYYLIVVDTKAPVDTDDVSTAVGLLVAACIPGVNVAMLCIILFAFLIEFADSFDMSDWRIIEKLTNFVNTKVLKRS